MSTGEHRRRAKITMNVVAGAAFVLSALVEFEVVPPLIHWRPPQHGVWDDGVMFTFDGGELSAAQLSAVSLQADELASYKFVTLDDSAARVRPAMARRLTAAMAALQADVPTYLGVRALRRRLIRYEPPPPHLDQAIVVYFA